MLAFAIGLEVFLQALQIALLLLALRGEIGLRLLRELAGVGLQLLRDVRDLLLQLLDSRRPRLVPGLHVREGLFELRRFQHRALQIDHHDLRLRGGRLGHPQQRGTDHQQSESHA